jgi:hypothetical protein
MQVPRFSPRISLIEMAPRPTPRSGCPGRPALPYPAPALFVTTDRERAPQGTGQSSIPNDDAFPYGRFCSGNIENAFATKRRVIDRRTD